MVAITSRFGSAIRAESTATGPRGRAVLSRLEAIHDAELVRRFVGADEDAFVEIVARYRGKMLSIGYRHLGNHADAEEIAQDTFILAHRGLARFRGDSSLATWLYRIACNLSHNRRKYYSCRRRHVTLPLDCAFTDDNRATFSDLIASDVPSPAREATTREFSDLVASCTERLGTLQRDILMRRNGLNQSYGDIARGLGISIGTVKSRIGRARKNLRSLVAESYPTSAPGDSTFDWFESMRSCGRVNAACV